MDGVTSQTTESRNSAEPVFSYEEAFSRNLGWLTDWEQQALRHKRVAIAGMGGVGGFHLVTLARFGIGAFNIADFDDFALVNFNRQVGATRASVGRPKAGVMAEAARQINPELRINCFDRGIDKNNLDQFLAGVDLCIDGLDFFALDIRRQLNARCRELGIPVVIAGPLGMGTGFLIFQPDGMSFEEWFRVAGQSDEQQYVRFLLGLAPSALHRTYLVDPSRVDLRGHKGPSTVAGCELCAAVASVEAVKLLLRRGPIRAVPYYHQFDLYRGRFVTKKLRHGNANLSQRLKIALWTRLAAKWSDIAPKEDDFTPKNEIEQILDCARWAPSGDNTQPWRFEIRGPDSVIVHLTQPSDLYDYRDGEPTLLAGGALLESIRIAASRWGRSCAWHYSGRKGDTHHIAVSLKKSTATDCDPLISYLSLRSVDRRPFRLRRLTAEQKAMLVAALGPRLTVEWHETLGHRWRMARLGARATAIRLTAPEAHPIHQRVIDWQQRYSTTGIPAAASGINRISLVAMRWGMKHWSRMKLLNRLGGVVSTTIEMDYLPILASAAFFTIRADRMPADAPDRSVALLDAGQAIQRFWLTATRLRLALQPSVAAICFASYGEKSSTFTTTASIQRKAVELSIAAGHQFPGIGPSVIFAGRIGTKSARRATARAVRLPLRDLLLEQADARTSRAAYGPDYGTFQHVDAAE